MLLLLIAVIMIMVFPLAAMAEEPHTHFVCGEAECTHEGTIHTTAVTYTPVAKEADFVDLNSNPSRLEISGNYYLTDDVDISQEIWISADTNICLNGHTLTGKGVSIAPIVLTGGTINICDCSIEKDGMITSSAAADGGRSGSIYVQNANVNLYGGTIANNQADKCWSGAVSLFNSGTFNMYGGSIANNSGNYTGGVYLSNGVFNLYEGRIAENTGKSFSGGIYFNDSADTSGQGYAGAGIFHMYGGEIAGNVNTSSSLNSAGGIMMSDGTFYMHDGEIRGNKGKQGGGVAIQDKGVFVLEDGSITQNEALGDQGSGGGIFNTGILKLYGGSITDNKAEGANGGGILGNVSYGLPDDRPNFLLHGNPIVTGNTAKGIENNLHLFWSTVTLDGALTEGFAIGISLYSTESDPNTGAFTDDWETHMVEKDPSAYFTSDISGYSISKSAENEAIVEKVAAEVVGDKKYASLMEAITAAGTKGTVKLLANIELSTADIVTVAEEQTIRLDMNGKSITVTEDFSGRPILNYGDLTITGNGTIDVTNATQNSAGLIDNYGTLTIDNGNFKSLRSSNAVGIWVRADSVAVFKGGVYEDSPTIIRTAAGSDTTIYGGNYRNNGAPAIENGGNMLISGGTFSNTSCSSCDSLWGYTIRNGVDNENAYLKIAESAPGSVQVTGVQGALANSGGLLEVTSGYYQTVACATHGSDPSHYALYVAGEHSASKCIVTGGTFQSISKTAVLIGNDNTNGDGGINEKATSEIKGGTFIAPAAVAAVTGAPNTGTPVVSGGNFSSSVAEKYLIESLNTELYSTAKNSDAPFSYYTSVQEALKDAGSGGKVTVLGTDDTKVDTVTLQYTDDESYIVRVENGAVFALPSPTRSGYRFSGWELDGNKITEYTASAEGGKSVTIIARWARNTGGGSSTPTYTVELPDDMKNGSITVSSKNATKDSTVIITVIPNEGYLLEELVVTDKNGKEILLTKENDSKYSFVMPASKVEIAVSFQKDSSKEHDCPSEKFYDIDTTLWYHEALDYVIANGFMKGISDTSFAPQGTMTRGMMVTILYRLEGEPTVSGEAMFIDSGDPIYQYYTHAVNWAATNHIVEGYGDGSFGPEDAITREQFSAILYRYATVKGYDTTQGGMAAREFADYALISDWAQEAMDWAVNAQIIKGNGNNLLNPNEVATRAEIAQMIFNFLDEIAK